MKKWELWLENSNVLDKDFNSYLKDKIIRKEATKLEVEGHLNKAKRNLRFAKRIIDEFKDYYDWAIIAYYYAIYQAALSLCANKGLKTKRHIATILILIKFYYPKHINKSDLKAISESVSIEEQDIKEFVSLKDYREDAAYSISVNYERNLAENLGSKAVDFVNKAERIIKR